MLKNITNFLTHLKLVCVMLLFSGSLFAQQINVSGVVTDGKAPLIGATISVKGGANPKAVTTDNAGKFTLNGIASDATLEVSYIGYKSAIIKVNNRKVINVALEEEAKSLDEVVVVSYGTQKKSTLTGAISTIAGDKITTTKSSSVAQNIQGKIAGVQIRQQDGQPGSFSSMVQIRGFGNPLYVIDGVVRDSGDGGGEFQRLSSEDIESISVLKDGSAAIYGMNAANGVIIITTKKGNKGRAKFSYNGSVTTVLPTSMLEVMNAAQYMEVMNEFSLNNGSGAFTTPEELKKWQEGGPGYGSTDWLGQTFKNHTLSTQHTLSVQGGNDDVTYYTSVGYVKDGDLTKGGDFNYNRYNFRSNISAKLSKYLTADVNVSGRYDETESPIAGIFDIMFKSSIMRPTSGIYANNDPNHYNYAAPFNDNSFARMDGDLTGFNKNRNRSFQSSASLRFDLPWVDGMYAKLMAAYDASDSRTTHERKKFPLYVYDKVAGTYSSQYLQDPTNLWLSMGNGNRMNVQTQLGYNHTFNKDHNVSVMAMYELNREWNDSGSAGREYEIYSKPIIDQGSATNLTNGGSYGESANISYMGRLNYDYKGKYLIEGAFRYNGSYRYAKDQRWGFFPVASLGWRLSEEAFVKDNASWIENLKIRASYGSTGVDAGDAFQYMEGFTTSGNRNYEFSDGKITNGVGMPGMVNKSLTWMKSTTLDIGVDISLWKGLVDFTFDVYQRDLTDIPANPVAQITNTFGASLPQINFNSNRTQGVEFTVGHNNTIKDFRYGVQANFNFSRTKDVKVARGEYSSSWDKWRSSPDNRWQGIGWGYKTMGQFTNMDQIYGAPVQMGDRGNTLIYPGDYFLEDLNGDGYIDGNDLQPMYYSVGMPAVNYGITLAFGWKNIDFNALFQGSACYSLVVPDNLRNYSPWDGNSMSYLYDRWHREDLFDVNSKWVPGKFPSSRHANYTPMGNNASQTDRNTVKGDYLRLKSVELGYTIPSKAAKYIGLESVRVYVNAYNVLSFYNSFLKNDLKVDPEKTLGQDNRMLNYPLASTINFGINVNF